MNDDDDGGADGVSSRGQDISNDDRNSQQGPRAMVKRRSVGKHLLQ